MIRAAQIRALRLALLLCLRVGFRAEWLAGRIARRLAVMTAGKP